MDDPNSKPKRLVSAYFPFISQDEVNQTNETIRIFRATYPIDEHDYERITVSHNFVFRRHLQIDPVLRRKPAFRPGVPPPELFTTLDKPRPKAEAKLHLATIHQLLDKYGVPYPERRRFFKALTAAWYYVRQAAMANLQAESISMFQ